MEFVKVCEEWKRMCQEMCAMDGCKKCPVTKYTHGARCGDMPGEMEKIPEIESAIIKWAKENPEPVYPTWGTWLATKYGYDLREIVYEPIPADIAQKLGLEPKEER